MAPALSTALQNSSITTKFDPGLTSLRHLVLTVCLGIWREKSILCQSSVGANAGALGEDNIHTPTRAAYSFTENIVV